MILIEENFDNLLTEAVSVGDGKKYYLTGVFGEALSQNRNNRRYDLKEMTQEANRFNELAMTGNAVLGELDHPSTLEIKLKNVSHKIVEMKMVNNQLIGKAEVLRHHPNGLILEGLIKDNVRVGVSTRGSGQVNESSGMVKNFRMVTVDAVATPSCRTAFPETLREQVEMYKRGELIEIAEGTILNDSIAQKYFEIELRKFINTLGLERK